MSPVSHQTIKLSKGRHRSPNEGACVMELASMLAGEPFSDHPQSVCPVIGSFLRAYNDLVDDRRRQDLYAYAAKIVHTSARPEVEDARAERLLAWTHELTGRAGLRRRWWRRRGEIHASSNRAAGTYAVHAIARQSRRTHAAVLAVVDELVAIGRLDADEVEPLHDAAPAGAAA